MQIEIQGRDAIRVAEEIMLKDATLEQLQKLLEREKL